MRGAAQEGGRRLAAIFAADVAGYSRQMELDEVATLDRLRAHRSVMDRLIAERGGRIANTAGDSVLAEFPSVVEAVQCSLGIQQALAEANAAHIGPRLQFRIGVHVGDVLVQGGDLFGDGVNIAARLQALAEPGQVCLSGDAYAHVRKVPGLTFTRRGPQKVKNIADAVEVYTVVTGSARQPQQGETPLPLPDIPSIAVLPFDNMSSDPEQVYFADGMVEDIIAALSRVRSFFVIARASTFVYKGRPVPVQQVARELGVRYVLEGSVRRAGERLRVAAQLVDAVSGAHLWADHYDGTLQDAFDLQDSITASVVGALQPSIRAAEIERARRKRPDNLDAYDLVMRALPFVWSLDRESNRTATELLEQALRLDPAYPLALSLAAWCRGQRVVYNWSQDPEADRRETLRQAQEAAARAADDPFVLTVLAAALAITHEFSTASSMIDKALALDPNSAWAWNRSGWVRSYLGETDRAIEHFNRSLRLSPFDPMVFNCHVGIAGAHFVAERYAEAAIWFEKGLIANPKATWINRTLAASYALAGRQRDAEDSLRRLREAYPGITVAAICAAHPFTAATLARLAEGLQLAGLTD